MEILAVIGKIFFSLLFLDAGKSHFQYKDANVAYARSKGIMMPELAVVITGLILVIAPLMIIFNIAEMFALISLAVFLFATCVLIHNYWQVSDTQAKQIERISFYKNLSLFGAVLALIATL